MESGESDRGALFELKGFSLSTLSLERAVGTKSKSVKVRKLYFSNQETINNRNNHLVHQIPLNILREVYGFGNHVKKTARS